jgi:hypothetical protein
MRSFISLKENHEKIMQDAESSLESFAMGYDSIASAKSHTDPIQKKIQAVNFLPGYSNKDNEEEIGAKLSENIVN